jgi:hypothetical protein
MFRSHTVWLAPATLILLSFGLGDTKARAQIEYPFETVYNAESTLIPITTNILKITNIGESANAPYGLTKLVNENYGKLNPDTGVITLNPDPTTFGLKDLPLGNITIFGQESDRLFGTVISTAALDFQNLVGTVSGTITITGGSGKFSGATGILTLSENLTLSPDPTASVRGLPLVKGSFQVFQTVPEPRNITALICVGMIGANFLLHQHGFKVLVRNYGKDSGKSS